MNRILMVSVFVGGLFYLYKKQSTPAGPTPEEIVLEEVEKLKAEIPEPPPELEEAPPIVLSNVELQKIRLSTKDSNSEVRWAAIELLHRLQDPLSFKILQDTLRIDTEVTVRHKALQILQGIDRPEVAVSLVKSLRDTEKQIRMAALVGLGEIANPETTPHIVQALVDVDPDVRTQALHTLGRIQEKKDEQHKQRQEKIRADYEEKVREIESKMEYKKQKLKKTARDLLKTTMKQIEGK
ncbi:MAG: hypothetical protein COB53_04430 [Elusimicrobia bacterium]|nr:MAG: hypothetical protein COB53_04430 [Elusimicrobiota bacterium]